MIGWLNLDKPEGISSAKAVAIARRAYGIKKIGHAGTLDPLASGVLPLAIGEATKTVQYVMSHEKTYSFTVTFGTATDSDDLEGKVIERSDVRPTKAALQAALTQFTGCIQQTPPAYSAIKIDGKRAYALAREGKAPVMQAREVDVYSLAITSLEFVANDDSLLSSATLICHCGKGTYIRSLARDLARALGTVGHVSMLRRTAYGAFTEKNALSLAILEKAASNPACCAEMLISQLISVESVLDDITAIEADDAEWWKLSHGQVLTREDVNDEQTVTVKHQGLIRAMASVQAGKVKIKRVIHQPIIKGNDDVDYS